MTTKQEPPTDRVRAALDTLVGGTEDDRDALVKTLAGFDEREQDELRTVVNGILNDEFSGDDYRLNDPRTAHTIRGWLVFALAALKPLYGESRELLIRLAFRDPNEWVRYWCLAHLYWSAASGVEGLASALEKDDSDLVRTLAAAITTSQRAATTTSQRKGSQESEWLRSILASGDERRRWIAMRALQIVPMPEALPQVIALLEPNASDVIVYDVLLVLTARRLQDAGIRELHARMDPDAIVGFVARACRTAARHKVTRFASILRSLPSDRVGPALAAMSTSGADASSATVLLQELGLGPASVLEVPPGVWRLEFAYRAVLEQPARFELLETLDVANLREAIHAVGGASVTPDDVLARLRAAHGSADANPLWLAWVETTQAIKIEQS